MIINCFSIFCFPVLIIFLSLISSCSQITYNLPDLKSESIEDYKYLFLAGEDRGIRNTGVYVKKGNLYSIVASGIISSTPPMTHVLDKRKFEPKSKLKVRIAGKIQKIPPINATLVAQDTGEISVFTKNPPNQRISGGYKITIIVWSTRNLDYIADYFKNAELANPEQEQLEGISEQAISLKTYLNKLHPDSELSLKEKKSTEVEESTPQVSSKPDENKSSPTKPKEVGTESQITVGGNTDTNKINGDNYSPMMLIVSPRDGQTISSIAIQLIGVVEDDSGLQKVDIFINGKPITVDQGRGLRVDHVEATKRYEFNEKVAVNSGENFIKIVAEDVSGRITEQTMTVNRKDDKGKVWAVIVGVDTYTNLPHLKYAVKDAQAFNNLLLVNNLVPSRISFGRPVASKVNDNQIILTCFLFKFCAEQCSQVCNICLFVSGKKNIL